MNFTLLRRRPRPRANVQPVRDPVALMQRLEDRVLFAHLGHVVTLPDAAANGERGLEAAIDAPADHRRSRLVFDAVGG